MYFITDVMKVKNVARFNVKNPTAVNLIPLTVSYTDILNCSDVSVLTC